jgi:hypothetical protein
MEPSRKGTVDAGRVIPRALPRAPIIPPRRACAAIVSMKSKTDHSRGRPEQKKSPDGGCGA